MTEKQVRDFKIEEPEEGRIYILSATGQLSPASFSGRHAISALMRLNPEKTVIGANAGGNPAFTAWADKAAKGEKLPRGRYFRMRERLRAHRTVHTAFITVHAE